MYGLIAKRMLPQSCSLYQCRLHLCRCGRMFSTKTTTTLPRHPGISLNDIIVVDSPARWLKAIKSIKKEKVVGFDTESKPVFTVGSQIFYQKTSPHVIQIATHRKTYLFSMLDCFNDKSMVAQYLGPILENKRILKVGFDLKSDKKLLAENYGMRINTLDLSLAMPKTMKGRMSLSAAVEKYLHSNFEKSRHLTLSNWGQPIRCFDEKMLLYAANDAYLALLVYKAWIANDNPNSSIDDADTTPSTNQLKTPPQDANINVVNEHGENKLSAIASPRVEEKDGEKQSCQVSFA